MKNIRQNVFETNSSSTHSISISNKTPGVYDTLELSDDGVLVLNGGEFGWDWKRFHDALTKANYAAVHAYSNDDLKEMLRKVLREHTGAKAVVFNFSDNFNDDKPWGYIDHDSVGVCNDAFLDEDTLKEWIFNPDSYLITGNDNAPAPPNIFDPLNVGYKYLLKLEGTDVTASFCERPTLEEVKTALYAMADRLPGLHDYAHGWRPNPTRFNQLNFKAYSFASDHITSYDELDDGVIIPPKIAPTQIVIVGAGDDEFTAPVLEEMNCGLHFWFHAAW